MKDKFKSVAIHLSTVCNLKCKYCYFHKDGNAIDGTISKLYADAVKNNAYIEYLKRDFSPKQLNNFEIIELWGGEPLFGMSDFINNMKYYFELLPSLKTLMISSNFTLDNSAELLQAFSDEFCKLMKNTDKQGTIYFQVSIDGNKEINDVTRGVGSTEKAVANLLRVSEAFKKSPCNVNVYIGLNPTMPLDSFLEFKDEYNCRRWISFMGDLINTLLKNRCLDRVSLGPISFADPLTCTSYEGVQFSQALEMFYNTALTMQSEYNFDILGTCPYIQKFKAGIPEAISDFPTLIPTHCGAGCSSVVYAHDGARALCHRGVMNHYETYNKNSNFYNKGILDGGAPWIYKTTEEADRIYSILETYTTEASKSYFVSLKSAIKAYAVAGLIDSKYLEDKHANLAAYCMGGIHKCLQSNLEQYGSILTEHYGTIPLLCNGALDFILEKIKEYHETVERFKQRK